MNTYFGGGVKILQAGFVKVFDFIGVTSYSSYVWQVSLGHFWWSAIEALIISLLVVYISNKVFKRRKTI